MTKMTKATTKAQAKAAAAPGAAPKSQRSNAMAAPVSSPTTPRGKIATVIALLRRPDGARIDDLTAATGWQAHSVRGAMSGAIKKKLGFEISSEKAEGVRTYRIAGPSA